MNIILKGADMSRDSPKLMLRNKKTGQGISCQKIKAVSWKLIMLA